MQLSEQQLQDKYDEFISFIKKNFSGDRLKKLLKLYSEDDFGTRLILAPASGKEHFHLAFVGGYMQHVLNVCKAASAAKKLWLGMGGTIDFTDEELMFACLHHDLGKLGNLEHEYYLPNDNEWSMRNRGEQFKFNPKLQYMEVAERALFILQHYGITVTEKEWLGIRLADGPFSESNRQYIVGYNKDYQLKTNLPYVVHMADFVSCRSEFDQWKREQ